MKTLKFSIGIPLMVLLFVAFAEGSERRDSVHLSMDKHLWETSDGALEKFGCLLTSDAVSGEAIMFEGRSFLKFSSPKLHWLGDGDFTISLWLKVPAYTADHPWFTEYVLDGPRIVFKKADSVASIMVEVDEGRVRVSLHHLTDLEEAIKYIEVPAKPKPDVFNDNKWHHIVLLNNNGDYQIWLDGEMEWKLKRETQFDYSSVEYLLFGGSEEGKQFLQGCIDEFIADPWAWQKDDILSHYESNLFRMKQEVQ